jgi:hypothetical protein
VGHHSYTPFSYALTANARDLGVTSRFRALLTTAGRIEYFCGRGQEKVAKIVHCGKKILTQIKNQERPPVKEALRFR